MSPDHTESPALHRPRMIRSENTGGFPGLLRALLRPGCFHTWSVWCGPFAVEKLYRSWTSRMRIFFLSVFLPTFLCLCYLLLRHKEQGQLMHCVRFQGCDGDENGYIVSHLCSFTVVFFLRFAVLLFLEFHVKHVHKLFPIT